jgi:hypothetical protein
MMMTSEVKEEKTVGGERRLIDHADEVSEEEMKRMMKKTRKSWKVREESIRWAKKWNQVDQKAHQSAWDQRRRAV